MVENKEKKVIMNKDDMAGALQKLAREIVDKNSDLENIAIVGIQTRGVQIGRRIAEEIKKVIKKDLKIPFGTLGITLYRDDVDTMTTPPPLKETDISFDISGKKVILVDDVIFTGRSIRAALDEMMDFGRPKNIQLAVLIDRGNRELPIMPKYIGKKIESGADEIVDVSVEEVDGRDEVVIKEKG